MAGLLKKDGKDVQIGFDIGSQYIKAVAVSHAGSTPQLVNFSTKPVSDNIIETLKDVHAELGFTKTTIVTSISGPAVIVRYVELPSMSEEELEGATRFEAEKVIPYNIDEVEIDSVKMEDLDGNRIGVIIVVAKKDLIDSQIKMINEASFNPVILDVDSFAMLNSFSHTGIDTENVCGLLNIGAKRSNLCIVKNGIPYLSRDIDIGGLELTKAIAENLSKPQAEAEKIKLEKLNKFIQLSEEERKGIEAPLADLISRLGDEVRLSFDFYENHYTNPVTKVYISGGMSIPEITVNLLKESLGRDALKWDPLTNIEISDKLEKERLDILRPQLAVAAGLGLRSII